MAIEDSDGNDMSVLDDNLDNIEDIDNMNRRNVNGASDSGEEGKEVRMDREASTGTGRGATTERGAEAGISASERNAEKWQIRKSMNYDSDDNEEGDDEEEGEDEDDNEEEDEEDELGDRGMTFIPLYQVSGMPIWMPNPMLSDREIERKREMMREIDIETAVTAPFSIIELGTPKDKQNVVIMQSESYSNISVGSEKINDSNNDSNYHSKSQYSNINNNNKNTDNNNNNTDNNNYNNNYNNNSS